MNSLTMTPKDIYEEILDLSPHSLVDLAAFIEFLRFKAGADAGVGEEATVAAPPAPAAFLQAIAAFERLKPQLLSEHGGRVVAIYQDRVVAVGDDRLSVFDEVVQKYGYVPCYIEWVEPETSDFRAESR